MNDSIPQTTAGENDGQRATEKNGSVEQAASKLVKALSNAYAEVYLAQPPPLKRVHHKAYRLTHSF